MRSLEYIYQYFLKYPQISTDSRNIKHDSIFVALKGEHFDGNQYAEEALNKGAAYVIVDDPSVNKNDARYILVHDALKTLQELAFMHRKNYPVPLIGITGSNGKTTTRNLTARVLGNKYKVLSPKKNLNNHIGVPLTLLELKDEHEIAVIEMGANHPGEIDLLCKIAQPTHGIITNIGKAHLEGFGSYEGVFQTKTELYRYLENVKGTIFYNNDDPLLAKTANNLNCEKFSYGTTNSPDFYIESYKTDPYVHLSVSPGKNKDHTIRSNLIGLYNLENMIAALSIGSYFKIPMGKMKKTIQNYIPNQNRSQIIETKSNYIILDAYNANPTSMKLAIENFSLQEVKNKTLILGDMFELGKYAEEEHQQIINYAENKNLNEIYLVGKHFSSINTGFHKTFHSTQDFIDWLTKNPLSQKSILIKGSRGMTLEKLIEYL